MINNWEINGIIKAGKPAFMEMIEKKILKLFRIFLNLSFLKVTKI